MEQEVEVLGYNKTAKGKVTGIEMFHKILEEANDGDQMDLLASPQSVRHEERHVRGQA